MDCAEFQALFPTYDTGKAPGGVTSPKFSDWCEHFHDCAACGDWALGERVKRWGHDPRCFPCIHMAYRALETCDQHPDRAECQDLFIEHDEARNTYYLIKGQVRMHIDYCPWCGTPLPRPEPT